mmetsp:Transcript_4150/g.14862  ORF Transcript_4150/g.14862 Transcript_4150/m.14862 type:complete len:273 (-) Transcript_4150:261-1079(-)
MYLVVVVMGQVQEARKGGSVAVGRLREQILEEENAIKLRERLGHRSHPLVLNRQRPNLPGYLQVQALGHLITTHRQLDSHLGRQLPRIMIPRRSHLRQPYHQLVRPRDATHVDHRFLEAAVERVDVADIVAKVGHVLQGGSSRVFKHPGDQLSVCEERDADISQRISGNSPTGLRVLQQVPQAQHLRCGIPHVLGAAHRHEDNAAAARAACALVLESVQHDLAWFGVPTAVARASPASDGPARPHEAAGPLARAHISYHECTQPRDCAEESS